MQYYLSLCFLFLPGFFFPLHIFHFESHLCNYSSVQYMKMVAMPYLHHTLGKAVKDLFEEKRSCEVLQLR